MTLPTTHSLFKADIFHSNLCISALGGTANGLGVPVFNQMHSSELSGGHFFASNLASIDLSYHACQSNITWRFH